jgi:very-short-patch-repair endonuclease
MRRNPTPSEHALWLALRDSKLGVKFRRQHVLAPFIVDFYAASLRLVIEVDGSVHEGREARDASRTAKLVALYGVRVVRVDSGSNFSVSSFR